MLRVARILSFQIFQKTASRSDAGVASGACPGATRGTPHPQAPDSRGPRAPRAAPRRRPPPACGRHRPGERHGAHRPDDPPPVVGVPHRTGCPHPLLRPRRRPAGAGAHAGGCTARGAHALAGAACAAAPRIRRAPHRHPAHIHAGGGLTCAHGIERRSRRIPDEVACQPRVARRCAAQRCGVHRRRPRGAACVCGAHGGVCGGDVLPCAARTPHTRRRRSTPGTHGTHAARVGGTWRCMWCTRSPQRPCTTAPRSSPHVARTRWRTCLGRHACWCSGNVPRARRAMRPP